MKNRESVIRPLPTLFSWLRLLFMVFFRLTIAFAVSSNGHCETSAIVENRGRSVNDLFHIWEICFIFVCQMTHMPCANRLRRQRTGFFFLIFIKPYVIAIWWDIPWYVDCPKKKMHTKIVSLKLYRTTDDKAFGFIRSKNKHQSCVEIVWCMCASGAQIIQAKNFWFCQVNGSQEILAR